MSFRWQELLGNQTFLVKLLKQNKLNKTNNKIFQIFRKTLIVGFFVSITALIAVFAIVQLPSVQNIVLKSVAAKLGENIDYPIQIGNVSIGWLNELVLYDIVLKDRHEQEMLRVDKILVRFNVPSMLRKNVQIDKATLVNAIVSLEYDHDLGDVNLSNFIYAITHLGVKPGTTVVPKPKGYKYSAFKIKEVAFINATCSYNDPTVKYSSDRFDFAHFEFNNINIVANDFNLVRDTVRANITDMNAVDKYSKIAICDLKSEFGICENFITLSKLSTYLGDSYISNYIKLDFNKFSNLAFIEDSVKMDINLNKSIIYAKDIAVFQPDLKNFEEVWKVSGSLKGIVRNFKTNNLSIGFGNSSLLETSGYAHFSGFPNWDSTYMKVQVNKGFILAKDIKKYDLNKIGHILDRFSNTKLKGEFKGFPTDFSANFDINTAIGDITANIKVKTPKINFAGSYDAHFTTKDLNIGRVVQSKQLENITGKFDIKGQGFDNNADLILISNIENVGLHGYNYHNVNLDARMANKYLQGSLDVNDPNMKIDLIGNYNFKSDVNKIEIDAHLNKINLLETKLYKRKLQVRSNIKIKTNGLDLKDMEGFIKCNRSNLKDSLNDVNIEYFEANYYKKNSIRNFSIKSDKGNLNMEGKFELPILANKLSDLANDLKLIWQNNDTISASYYVSKKMEMNENQHLSYTVNFLDIKPLCQIFTPFFIINKGTNVSGIYKADTSSILTLQSTPDTIQVAGVKYVNNQISINLNKQKSYSGIKSNIIFKSNLLMIDGAPTAENLSFVTNWENKNIDFEFSLKQFKETNAAFLAGNIAFLPNLKQLKFKNSYINLLDNIWPVSTENSIFFKSNRAEFNKVEMVNANQRIAISGVISPSEDKAAILKIENFNLKNFNKLFNINFDGDINALVLLKDIFKNPRIESTIDVNNLKINNIVFGQVKGLSSWENENQRLAVTLDINQNDAKIFSINGFYKPKVLDPTKHLQVKVFFNNTNLSVLEPFVTSSFSQLQGQVKGTIDLQGSFSKPLLNGNLSVNNAEFKINYLNTVYNFSNEKINITPSKIMMQNIKLKDINDNILVIDGSIMHTNFTNPKMKLVGQFTNFNILNTSQTDSSIYFGTAIASGDFNIDGTFKEFKIKVNASAQKGTHLTIPLNNESSVVSTDFISFAKRGKLVDKTASGRIKKISKNNFKVEMDFNFELTPDAYCEIILDPNSGDKISGYGQGLINTQINTDGNFNIFGNYEFINESYYYFSFLNSINKKFNIRKGSKVSFNGDPYAGQLDITASYDDRVSLQPLVTDTSEWRVPGVKAAYPVSTILFLKGDLLKPTIKYDIFIQNYPTAIGRVPMFSYVTAFENKIRNNENEMNNQVFGLLVFRKFLSTGTLLENAIGGTVSELLSSQVSNIISRIDPNLSLDLNLNGLNRDALNAMQVRVSYTLLDGKIRITRSTGNVQNQNATANVIGEWTVEYMLTNDGKYRLKGFNRYNPNTFSTSNTPGGNAAAGFSIMHTAGFNTLNPFSKKKKKKLSDKDKN